jgi:hypothetical protein
MSFEGTLVTIAEYWPQILSIAGLVLVSAFFSGS